MSSALQVAPLSSDVGAICRNCPTHIQRGKYCDPCRAKRRAKPRKYIFTPRIDDAIKAVYLEHPQSRSKPGLKAIAQRLGWPKWVITKRGIELGLARSKDKPWSEREVEILELPRMFNDAEIIKSGITIVDIGIIIGALAASTSHMRCGSTLSLAFIHKNTRTANIAIIGDSPIIVHTKDGIDISPEHNVRTNLAERQAAISRGGYYQRGYICDRISHKGLQLSRALGDCLIRPAVSSEPEIYTREIQDWILLASDGLFDPKHTGPALCAENFKLFADLNAQQMVDTAVARHTGDNATAIMVHF